MKLHKGVLAVIDEQMAAAGIVKYDIAPGGKHPRLVFVHNGRSRTFSFVCTPSDHRSVRNTARDLRHFLGLVPDKASANDTADRPAPAILSAAVQRVRANPPMMATAKDRRVLNALRDSFEAAGVIERRSGGSSGVERLERLVCLNLADGDGEGRYRRRPVA